MVEENSSLLVMSDSQPSDISVGMKDDGRYHLLGFRPRNASPYFSESQMDGIVNLPEGRKDLGALVKGDILRWERSDLEAGEFVYIAHNS